MKRHIWISVALLMVTCRYLAQGPSIAANGLSIQTLFCAYGGTGMVPRPMPVDFEAYFAVVVLELESRTEIRDVGVSDFVLIDEGRQTAKLKRVVRIEEFSRPISGEGEAAYYLNEGGARPWDGRLPAGKIRLRIRMALDQQKYPPATRFRLTFGGRVLEGPVNARWPT